MIEFTRDLSASGAGDSFFRFSIALSTMPFGSPSLAGKSKSTVSTPALARCAAICAPMTPAPSTAARRISSREWLMKSSWKGKRRRGFAPLDDAQASGGELDQVFGGEIAVLLFGHAGRALDH